MRVRQHKSVSRLEINLRLVIWNEVIPQQYLPPLHILAEVLSDCRPVFLASIYAAGDDQAIILVPGQELPKRRDQILEAFVRRNSAKRKQRLFTFTDS